MFPPDIGFAGWDSIAPGQCRGYVGNSGFAASNVRVQIFHASASGEVYQTVVIPGVIPPYSGASFVVAAQMTAGHQRFPRVGVITYANEHGTWQGSIPAQPRTPRLSFPMPWCRLGTDSAQGVLRSDGGYAYDMVIQLETRDGPRDVVLDQDPLPRGEYRFNSLVGDSAGVAIQPRVTSIHWEDYGGVPGDLVSPPTVPGLADCGQPWGTPGSGAGQFIDPSGVAVDASGNVYVADGGNDRIQKFTENGVYITQWGTSGTGDGQFHGPTGVAVDAGGNVYVADYRNSRLQVFTSNGTFVRQWGMDGAPNYPSGPVFGGVAVDPAGDVYVTDVMGSRVQKFTSSGTLVTRFGSSGTGDGQFDRPIGVAVDAGGDLYVTDNNNDRVESFTSTGVYAHQWGVGLAPMGQLSRPLGVAVDGAGNLFVADDAKHRIQKFGPPPSATSLVAQAGSASHRRPATKVR